MYQYCNLDLIFYNSFPNLHLQNQIKYSALFFNNENENLSMY